MRRTLGLAGPLLLSCAHGGTPPPGPPAAGPAAPAALARLVDGYLAGKAAFEPSVATAAGLHRHDSALEDLSAGRIAARVAELRALLQSLGAVDAAPLSRDDSADLRFLTAQVRAELLDLDGLAAWRWNPMRYAALPGQAVDALMKRDFAPVPQRMTAMAARLRAVPALYQAARDNLVDPPPELTALALRLAGGTVDFFATAVPAWVRRSGADGAPVAELQAANAAALAATRAFVAWLRDDLAPRSHGRYALGPGRFAEKLRLEEMIDTPLPALLAEAEAQLARDRAAFLQTAARIDRARPATDVMAALSADHPDAAGLIPAVARSIQAARRFVEANGLATLPSPAEPRVQETPPYARAAVFASMDTPGAFETAALPAYYYVTPPEPDWTPEHRDQHLRMFNRHTVDVINVHEAYPGHFLQFLYAPRFPGKVRKLLASTANVEGWAHYAEQMMLDAGFGDGDPRLRLAQLQEALLRDCRYIAAIQMHTQGMTVDEAARLFAEQGFQEPANAREEALRGTYDPMYLAYTLGKLQIQRLRDDYLAAHPGAPLRAFHDAFVAQGGLPLPLMREALLPRRP